MLRRGSGKSHMDGISALDQDREMQEVVDTMFVDESL